MSCVICTDRPQVCALDRRSGNGVPACQPGQRHLRGALARPKVADFVRRCVVALVASAVVLGAPYAIPDSSTRFDRVPGSDSERVEFIERAHEVDAADHNWQVNKATFYKLYGQRTACGQTVTPDSQWVAVAESRRKEFPCGTLIRFEWHGRELVVPVNDVCPGCEGYHLWDLSAGACHYLSYERPDRCSTGAIAWTR